MREAIVSSPLLGIVLCCLCWCAGQLLQKKTGLLLLNPLIVAAALIILILSALKIPYEAFERGASLISTMLGPATAVLALNIYQQRALLGKYFVPVLAGCFVGCLVSVGSILLMCRVLVLEESIAASLLPKSVTTAIAVAISDSGGGIQSITVAAVIVAGLTGALFAPMFAKFFHITDPVAEGTAIGASSHALGTARAMELGPLQGAMSSIAICVCGIITSLLVLFFPMA